MMKILLRRMFSAYILFFGIFLLFTLISSVLRGEFLTAFLLLGLTEVCIYSAVQLWGYSRTEAPKPSEGKISSRTIVHGTKDISRQRRRPDTGVDPQGITEERRNPF